MTQTRKAPTATRKAAVNIATPAKKKTVRRGTKTRTRELSPLTSHIPIGFVAPSTAVEGTPMAVIVSFNAPTSTRLAVSVEGCWSGTDIVVAGPKTIYVEIGESNGSGTINAPSLTGSPNNLLVLQADYSFYSLTACVNILAKPVTTLMSRSATRRKKKRG